jgi:predicted metal-dependent HD superfamily phosphohydrolase
LPAWHLARDPCAIEFGIWYHDAVRRSEEKSAAVAVNVARAALLPISFGQKVERLIIATKHSVIITSQDEQLIVDVDLSILGQPKGRFDEYERQIRREYKHVPWDTFVAKRSAILKSFLDRPTIYLTQFFRNKYEAQARQNIARSLKQLAGGI